MLCLIEASQLFIVIILTLYMMDMRLRDIKRLIQGQVANRW